jgi:hypothetical protein
MPQPTEIPTLTGALDDMTARGFTAHFILSGGRLRTPGGAASYAPDQVVIVEEHRFEGISDPDDMAILYGLETRGGLRGTLADAFGVYADPSVGDFMRDVALRRGATP